MRYALRTDKNQALIVEALRAAGARVKVVHQPYDLRIWERNIEPYGESMFIEVKNKETAYGRKGLNAKQADEAQGIPVAMVDSVESALRALNVLRSKT